jgi:ubiquitin carboxyl-terminal hydrolase 4/11/15
LDLTGIVAKDHGDPEPIYDLFAVSNHSGGLGGGHYTAYGKNPKTKKWYMFNDSSTHEVDASEVVTKQAYVLFYQRRKGKSGGNGDKK